MAAAPSMRTELLVLLDERRARAAVAWQFVERYPKHSAPNADDALCEAFPKVWYSPAEWMALAGLSLHDHAHVAPFLFRTHAVAPDGTVSPEALLYARRLTASLLTRRNKVPSE